MELILPHSPNVTWGHCSCRGGGIMSALTQERNSAECLSVLFLFRLVGGEVFNVCPYTPNLQRQGWDIWLWDSFTWTNTTWNYFNTTSTWCLWLSQVISTSTERANRRPAASSRVPRAWIQGGRYSQWDSKPHWYPYSHRGRQCSPLTTHMPRGVRNPDSTRHTNFNLLFILSCTARQHQLLYSDRLTVCHNGSCESRAGGETVLPVVSSGIVVTHKHTPLQWGHQPSPL